jgi:hypothetical protein
LSGALVEENWLRTDEAKDVLSSLRHAIACLELAKTDKHANKWLILALLSALQGACVCHLTGTDLHGALDERSTERLLEVDENRRKGLQNDLPKLKIAGLFELLKRVREPESAGDRSNEKGIEIRDPELVWLERISTEIRNQFVHFSPMVWSIELSGVPDLAGLVVRIIRDIRSVGWAFRKKDDDWFVRLDQTLGELDRLLLAKVSPAD